MRDRWVARGSYLASDRGRCLKVQGPVSRLPYLEVRKQEIEARKPKGHTNDPPFLCTTNSSTSTWPTLPTGPSWCWALATRLGWWAQEDRIPPLNHAKLEPGSLLPAPPSPRPQGANTPPPPHGTQSILDKYVPGLLRWFLGFSQAKPATLGLFLPGA